MRPKKLFYFYFKVYFSFERILLKFWESEESSKNSLDWKMKYLFVWMHGFLNCANLGLNTWMLICKDGPVIGYSLKS